MTQEYQEVLLNNAHIIIGKNGVTPKMLEHINTQFKTNWLLKIKIMKEVAHTYGVDYFIEYLMKELQVYVFDVRGFTFIIAKRKKPGMKIPSKYRKMRAAIIKEPSSPSTEKEIIDTPIVDIPIDENLLEDDRREENPLEIDLTLKYGEDPEFINYDDEELLQHIDEVSDEIYGGNPSPSPVKPSDQERTPKIPTIKKKSSTYWPKGSSSPSSRTKGSQSFSKASRPGTTKPKKTSRGKSTYGKPSKEGHTGRSGKSTFTKSGKSRNDTPKKRSSSSKSSGKSRGRWNKEK